LFFGGPEAILRCRCQPRALSGVTIGKLVQSGEIWMKVAARKQMEWAQQSTFALLKLLDVCTTDHFESMAHKMNVNER